MIERQKSKAGMNAMKKSKMNYIWKDNYITAKIYTIHFVYVPLT